MVPALILMNREKSLRSTPNNSDKASISSDTTNRNAGSEELNLEKMKGPAQKTAQKRRKMDFRANVITDDEYAKVIAEERKIRTKNDKAPWRSSRLIVTTRTCHRQHSYGG